MALGRLDLDMSNSVLTSFTNSEHMAREVISRETGSNLAASAF